MNAIREWMARHRALSTLGVLLLACIVGEVFLYNYLQQLRAETDSARETLQQANALADEYQQLRKTIKRGSVRLKNPESFDIATLEELADENLRRKVGKTESRSSRESDALIHRIVEFSFEGVRRKSLAQFLWQAEQLDPAIHTQTLRLKRNRDNPELVDAEVQFSGYAKAKSGE